MEELNECGDGHLLLSAPRDDHWDVARVDPLLQPGVTDTYEARG
jgi:hypothetical protein